MHGNKTRYSAAFSIFRPDQVPGPFWGCHKHVGISRGDYLSEVDIKAVGKGKIDSLLHVWRYLVSVNISLKFVRQQDHYNIGYFGGIRGCHDRKSGCSGLVPAAAFSDPYGHVHAAVSQVVCMGMPLAAVAHNCDLFPL